ncbi:MAG: acetolactate decarboxylase [Candidatus Nanopelagicales bacterium]
MAQHLNIRLSDSLYAAVIERSQQSGQSVDHLVQVALAEALDVDHHSIFQVSTSGALVQGLYQGCVTVADLRRHGDLGLGTFEDLDGEMILVDGRCFQALSDGRVLEAPDDALTPFAAVVNFASDLETSLTDVENLVDLTNRLDQLRVSDNAIAAFRIEGEFSALELRAACRHESGTGLVDAVADQGLFHLRDVSGTLVGFWSPEYTRAISIAGYHLHFLSHDHAHGGHVLDLAAPQLTAQVHRVSDVHLAIPETEAFLAADLSGDTRAALDIAEH